MIFKRDTHELVAQQVLLRPELAEFVTIENITQIKEVIIQALRNLYNDTDLASGTANNDNYRVNAFYAENGSDYDISIEAITKIL